MDVSPFTTLGLGCPPGVDLQSFLLNMTSSMYAPAASATQSQQNCCHIASADNGGAAVPIEPAAILLSPSIPLPRCAGLDFANMKKEEAREEYKEKRRTELVQLGELGRIKRRKKNDSSMSEDQKYNRRLKMNQDSAAAARFAQDVYVQTLEELVATGEAEKTLLVRAASKLRSERDALAGKVHSLQHVLVAAYSNAGSEPSLVDEEQDEPFAACFVNEPAFVLEEQQDPASSSLVLRKMLELFDLPETAPASEYDPDLSRGIVGIMPARAV
jgi:hypothetical protein